VRTDIAIHRFARGLIAKGDTSKTMKVWAPRRERALFVHIPKTAGMTMRAALGSQYALEDRAPAVDWQGLRSLPRPLDAYKLFAGHFRYFLRRLLPADTKVFTFLRDPVERAISHLKHLATDPQFHAMHELARGRDLRAIARDPRIRVHCSNVMVGYMSRPRTGIGDQRLHAFPPEEDCCDAPETIDDALAALDEIDFVGFVDDFDNDFARLCDLLGLHPPGVNTGDQLRRGASRSRVRRCGAHGNRSGVKRARLRFLRRSAEAARNAHTSATALRADRRFGASRCLFTNRGAHQISHGRSFARLRLLACGRRR
jgi:hypothetical protein